MAILGLVEGDGKQIPKYRYPSITAVLCLGVIVMHTGVLREVFCSPTPAPTGNLSRDDGCGIPVDNLWVYKILFILFI
jgi:hypothetical protein